MTVTVALPLGDITANQLRSLADIVAALHERNHSHHGRAEFRDSLGEQERCPRAVQRAECRWSRRSRRRRAGRCYQLPGHRHLQAGDFLFTRTRAELRKRVSETSFQQDEAVQNLHIKISGCFNSCGQHHTADLGFYGVSRKIAGYAVPHFQVVLGGEWERNAGSYGLPVVAIPSKSIPQVVTRLTDRYVAERNTGETFKDFIKRVGKAELKKMLEDLTKPPVGDRSYFSDWGDPREYTLGDMGVGECAGEVVSPVEFGLAAAERELFEAQLAHEAGQAQSAGEKAYQAMLNAAKALVELEYSDVKNDPEQIASEFRVRYFDTKKFFDPFAGGKFAQYFFDAHAKVGQPYTPESSRYLMDEAQLFIDAAHSCYNRLGTLVTV